MEVTDADVRRTMGATSHHYRWQVAVKRKGETAVTVVEDVVWQVGRTGKVTPVLLVEPVSVSGATIRRVTAHNAGLFEKKGLGPGAEIEIIRSGEVIPKVEEVLVPAGTTLPEECPSCGTPLVRENDFLICRGEHCPAQVVQTIEHWFKTLGNADWFGRKTVEKMVRSGYDSLEKVYELGEEDFKAMGFGPVQSSNLAEAVHLSRTREVEDWRFLAALGIEDLGKGDSRKLLENFRLEELTGIEADRIEAVRGFGAVTARSVADGLARRALTLRHLLDLGFQDPAHGRGPDGRSSGFESRRGQARGLHGQDARLPRRDAGAGPGPGGPGPERRQRQDRPAGLRRERRSEQDEQGPAVRDRHSA